MTVRVGLLDADSGFYVEDNGKGIPESELDHIFDQGFSTNDAGNGLGLAIVTDVVSAHDWTISVKTGSDGGPTFEIRTE